MSDRKPVDDFDLNCERHDPWLHKGVDRNPEYELPTVEFFLRHRETGQYSPLSNEEAQIISQMKLTQTIQGTSEDQRELNEENS